MQARPGYGARSVGNEEAKERLSSQVQRAADMIQNADVLLVVAGAGMGVDSGLDTFRTNEGSYTLKDYHSKCQHSLFARKPEEAWEFHGLALRRFREAVPHQGFHDLLCICRAKASYYVCTSNVDGQFQKAGFADDLVFNAHGSMHLWQCMSPKCNRRHDPWPAGDWEPGRLPQCKYCKRMARPNVSLFDDNDESGWPVTFNTAIVEQQYATFRAWLRRSKGRRLCILEIGCGVSEHSLRMVAKPLGRWATMSDEWGLKPLSGSLVRVNPETTSCRLGFKHSFVHVHLGAATGLRRLCDSLDRPSGSPSQTAPALPSHETTPGSSTNPMYKNLRRRAPGKRLRSPR